MRPVRRVAPERSAPVSREIAVFGGSFNPPGKHHRAIAERLSRQFDEVIVVPCGPRPDKPMTNDVEPIHRAAMVDLCFRGLPNVRVELFDLEASTFTRTYDLDRIYRERGRPWHIVSDEFVLGGATEMSVIQRQWMHGKELWHDAYFAVINRTGQPLDPADLPPKSQVIAFDRDGSSLMIRASAFHRQSVDGMVVPAVARYLNRHGLYRGVAAPRQIRYKPDGLRCLIVADERNPESRRVAELLEPHISDEPDLIVAIGGDGTMLRAIREHWRRRVPFYGINTGHLGFLLNDQRDVQHIERELVLYSLPLLRVEVDTAEGETKEGLSFNDAWVERATGQTAWLNLTVDDREQLHHVVADGMMVATAAGSTSYARAMGATPIPLGTPALLVVGSNVLKPAYWRPAVLPLRSRVEFSTLDPVKRPLLGYIDGVPQGHVRAMRVRVSNIAAVELAFQVEHDPALKLARIQFP
jgi:NAD+ kinase